MYRQILSRCNRLHIKYITFLQSYYSKRSFSRTGAPDFTDPWTQPTPNSGPSKSLFFPDEAIYPGHPRFKTLTRNIRQRRGEKVAINIPSMYLLQYNKYIRVRIFL